VQPTLDPADLIPVDRQFRLRLHAVAVVSLHDVSSAIIYDRSMMPKIGGDEPDQTQDGSHGTNDHQNDADRMDIEPMLVRAGGDCEIKNRTYRKRNDARYQSCCHGNASC
jgi:hypothetical protein